MVACPTSRRTPNVAAVTPTITTDAYGGGYPLDLYSDRQIADLGTSLAEIGDEAVQDYRDDGFLAVRDGISAGQVTDALAGLDAVLQNPEDPVLVQFESWADAEAATPEERLDGVRRLMRFAGADARLAAIAADPDLLAVVRRLLGVAEVRMIQDMALLKPPGGGREKPWHQDKAFFDYDLAAPVIGVWIALDQATLANGCMHVIRGSHRGGAVPHFSRRDWQICDSDVHRVDDVAVPLPPGGMLLFDGYLHHGTPANRTTTRRRALQFHYAAADIATITTDDRLDVFGLEGRGAEC